MTTSQGDRATRFREMHQRVFVIANAWDAGSARIRWRKVSRPVGKDDRSR